MVVQGWDYIIFDLMCNYPKFDTSLYERMTADCFILCIILALMAWIKPIQIKNQIKSNELQADC